jgi:hypothetical protein
MNAESVAKAVVPNLPAGLGNGLSFTFIVHTITAVVSFLMAFSSRRYVESWPKGAFAYVLIVLIMGSHVFGKSSSDHVCVSVLMIVELTFV